MVTSARQPTGGGHAHATLVGVITPSPKTNVRELDLICSAHDSPNPLKTRLHFLLQSLLIGVFL
jgi:hypothetical protein